MAFCLKPPQKVGFGATFPHADTSRERFAPHEPSLPSTSPSYHHSELLASPLETRSEAGESSDVPWRASSLRVPQFPHAKGMRTPLRTLHPSPGGPFAAAPVPAALPPPRRGSVATPPQRLPQGLGPDSAISTSRALLSQRLVLPWDYGQVKCRSGITGERPGCPGTADTTGIQCHWGERDAWWEVTGASRCPQAAGGDVGSQTQPCLDIPQ